MAKRVKRTRSGSGSGHGASKDLHRAAAAAIEPLEARQLLSGAAWLSSDSNATWDASSSTLTVTGAATIIADPGADDPQVNLSGSGAQLMIEPTSDSVVQLGSLTLSNGGSAEITRPNATGFDPSSSLLVVVGTAGSGAALSIDSADGSTLGLEDNDLIVRAGSANESAYLGGVTLGSPAFQPADGQQNVLAVAADADPSDGPIQMTAGDQSATLSAGDVLVKYSNDAALGADHSDGPADIGPAFPGFAAMDFAQDSGLDSPSSSTPAYVVSATVNGNLPSLPGPSITAAQRSMVDSMLYTFSEPVTLDPSDAFSLAVASGQSGIVPTLSWTAISPDGSGASTQWAVSFSGASVQGGSIADGVYDLTLNTAAVTSEANPTIAAQPHQPDLFYRFFGDVQGTGRVNASDYNAFLSTYGKGSGNIGFIPCLDFNADGVVDSTDNNAFLANFNRRLTGTLSFSPAAVEPTNVSATANDPTSVTITWTAPATGTVSGYDIQRWSAEDGAWITIAQNIPASTTTYTDTTVDSGTDYQYQVNAVETAGTSDWSETPAEVTTPLAPLQLVALGTDAGSVSLSWGAVAGTQSYNIYRQGPDDDAPVFYDSVDAPSPSYTDTGVNADSAYSYQVTAVTASGESSPGNTVAARTLSDLTAGYETLWTYDQAPQNPSVVGSSASGGLELGVQFSSDVGGYISGIQFFKGAADIGTHAGELWDGSGDLLATANFTDESQSGWQQVDFSTPVLIAAGTPYTVSFHTTNANYFSDGSYFDAEYNNAPLHVAPNVNGVYAYGASAFPATAAGNADNYWVQPLFFSTAAVPGGLSATTASASEIDLSWNNIVPNISTIDVQRSVNGGPFGTIGTLGPTAASYPDLGLAENTGYAYQLIFHTSSGASLTSLPTVAYTLAAVDGLEATAVSDSEIDLSWNSNAPDASGFEIQQSIDNGANWTTLTTSATTIPYPVTGLSANEDYTFQVCAIRPGGDSQFSGLADAYTLPAAPSSLTATANGTNEIDLSWPGSDPNASYELQRWSNDSGFSTIAQLDPGTTSYPDTDVMDGTTYYYQLLSDNGSGESDPSSSASATTVLAAPTYLTATAASDGSVQLSWVNNSASADIFAVTRSTDATNFSPVTLDQNGIDRTTQPGTNYSYQVVAQNNAVTVQGAPLASAASNVATAATPPALSLVWSGSATVGQASTLSVTVQYDSSQSDPVTSISIDWGDGSPAGGGTPGGDGSASFNHTYSQIGSYTAIVTGETASGLVQATAGANVSAPVPPPSPWLSLGAPVVSGPQVTLTPTVGGLPAGGTVNGYLVNWGDGHTDNSLTHTYSPEYCVYEIWVLAITSAGPAPAGTGGVAVGTPFQGTYHMQPAFSDAVEGQPDTMFVSTCFIDPPPSTLSVDFGDGTTGTAALVGVEGEGAEYQAVHTYAEDGSYPVLASGGGYSSLGKADVAGADPAFQIAAIPSQAAQPGSPVSISASVSGLDPDDQYAAFIDWGDGFGLVPAALTVNGSTGTITATLPSLPPGGATGTVYLYDDEDVFEVSEFTSQTFSVVSYGASLANDAPGGLIAADGNDLDGDGLPDYQDTAQGNNPGVDFATLTFNFNVSATNMPFNVEFDYSDATLAASPAGDLRLYTVKPGTDGWLPSDYIASGSQLSYVEYGGSAMITVYAEGVQPSGPSGDIIDAVATFTTAPSAPPTTASASTSITSIQPGINVMTTDGTNVALPVTAKNSSGGYVVLNDDNDNGASKQLPGAHLVLPEVDPVQDSGVKKEIAGEHDLVPIVIPGSPSGQYKITYTPGVQLWLTADKAPGTINGKNAPWVSSGFIFDATKNTTLYVEGIAVGISQISLQWNPAPTKSNTWVPVDKVKEAVFQIAGPQYVPGFGTYSYAATVPGTPPDAARWQYNDGDGTLQSDDNGSSAQPVTFVGGPAIGSVVYSPAPGFQATRYVYVVQVSVDPGTINPPAIGNADLHLNGNFYKVNPPYSITWSNKVTILGPADPITGKQRGTVYMQVGYIQTANMATLNATYGTTVIHNQVEGNAYIDMASTDTQTQSTWPWYDSANRAGVTLPRNGAFEINSFVPGTSEKRAANIPQTAILSGADQPGASVYQSWNGVPLTSAKINFNLALSVAVRTADPENSANLSYFQEASANWHIDYTGTTVPKQVIDPRLPKYFYVQPNNAGVPIRPITSDGKFTSQAGVLLNLPSSHTPGNIVWNGSGWAPGP